MELKYGLDEHPPFIELLLFGLQWFAVTIPVIIIIGKIAAGLHTSSPEGEILYIQKLCFVMAAALVFQVTLGHRLPLIIGPSTVLLIGIIASRGFGEQAIYSSILLGGVLLFIFSITGFFAYLKKFFTTRVVAVVMLLIAFTMAPTIMGLVTSPQTGSGPLGNLVFSFTLIAAMFSLYAVLKGIWKSTLVIWAMAAGSLIYYGLFPYSFTHEALQRSPAIGGFLSEFIFPPSWDAGVLISFLFCYLALAVNDLGSIQSLNELLRPADQQGRITRGMLVTGLANIASGILGVIGPVNFSLSPGVIASSRCGSRQALLPAAFLLAVLSISPALLSLLGNVPSVVVGAVLVYILCAQISSGITLLQEAPGGFDFETGLLIGLSILLGTIVAFLPAQVLETFPAMLRPVLGNGFVVGVLAALMMEHLVFRKKGP